MVVAEVVAAVEVADVVRAMGASDVRPGRQHDTTAARDPSPVAGEAGRPLALQACSRPDATFVQTSCQGTRTSPGESRLSSLKSRFMMGVKAADTTSPEAVAREVAALSYLRLEFRGA